MKSYIEYDDKIAFHLGYYVKELVEESGLSQEDFAKRLDTTPKNLSKLINREQSLSFDMAYKLSRMMGTSIQYWLNLQNNYDALITEFESNEQMKEEKRIFGYLDYCYFQKYFNLPSLPRKIDAQIEQVRKFLGVSTLKVFKRKDLTVSFRSSSDELSESNTVKANVLVQIAMNLALGFKEDAPKFNSEVWKSSVNYALTLTNNEYFYEFVRKAFMEAGVIFIVLPNMKGSKINGATKKIGKNILLMVNDRGQYADTFWFTLFHEIDHIMNGDYGISLENEKGENERATDQYAAEMLIPKKQYDEFREKRIFSKEAIIEFARKINLDPGIIAGRLEKDKLVDYTNKSVNSLRRRYTICSNT